VSSYPLDAILQKLSELAPLRLAESWDNVGLLVGNRGTYIEQVMTCLTITPEVVQEAIERQVGLLVVHHPLPFKPLARITSDTTTGQMLLSLISHHVAIYSAHTAFDSSREGINAQWASGLGLTNVRPLDVSDAGDDESIGSGRYGVLDEPVSLEELARRAMKLVNAPKCRVVESNAAEPSRIRKVAIACGSGGSLLGAAVRRGCDAMITGEATFHTCLEARASGVSLVLTGHFWSERFAMEWLAERLAQELKGLNTFSSEQDADPLKDVE
jgi:dinuclear metal center YbgI/SA1388 family protein